MPKVSVRLKGEEQQPIVIIDDFFPEPDRLLKDAAAREYSQIGPYYPGIRATVPDWYAGFVLQSLAAVFTKVFAYPSAPAYEEGMYSIATTPPEELMPIQLFPHYDGVDPDKLAVLHYLCGPDMGGTSFYRHRSTGFETVTTDRFATFKDTLEAEIRDSGVPQPRYIGESTEFFEKIDHCEARFNRLVIYRGMNLHSADIHNDVALSSDPATGRLTVNTFLVRPADR
ncbi:MAG: DUF6445 family protein [Woeseiaceae bacterium]|nr:DUF6445 family protein [Woeseiaceae bacterium]